MFVKGILFAYRFLHVTATVMENDSPSIYSQHLELHNTYITKLTFPIWFRSVSQSTNTHTGNGTLRNETERDFFYKNSLGIHI